MKNLPLLFLTFCFTALFAPQMTLGQAQEDTYSLDDFSRNVNPKGKVKCPRVELVKYKGKHIRYHKPVAVYKDFRERLKLFEEVVKDVAVEVYGRAPKKIVHLGTYNCRRIALWPNLVSEHGVGNAIDVAGFDFGRTSDPLPEGLPRSLKKAFKVRMLSHWNGKRGAAKFHRKFLRTLGEKLIARKDIFRVLLGPSYPGHRNHFHFDVAPYRLIDIFGAGVKKDKESS